MSTVNSTATNVEVAQRWAFTRIQATISASSTAQNFLALFGFAMCLCCMCVCCAAVRHMQRQARNLTPKEILVLPHSCRPPIPMTPFTRAEVARHNTKTDCWIVVHNLVLNVTEYMPLHPGGEKTISVYAGGDATDCYDSKHYADTIELYAPEVIVGRLADSTTLSCVQDT